MAQFIRPTTGRLTSFYGRRFHPIFRKWMGHHGIDIADAGRVAIKAAASGYVSRKLLDGTPASGGYGNCLMVKHPDGKETVYAHLSGFTVNRGQRVAQGQVIGYMGSTGNSTGQHLHFELHKSPGWNNGYTNEDNPLLYYFDVGVQELQAKLVATGINIKVDGRWGPATAHGVNLFQSRAGLEVDGSPGPATIQKLDSVITRINREAEERAASLLEQKRIESERKRQEAADQAELERLERVATSNKQEKKEEIRMEREKNAPASTSLAQDVARGVELGITDGTYLHRPATREEVISIVVRAMGFSATVPGDMDTDKRK